jgi:hypothetical protein
LHHWCEKGFSPDHFDITEDWLIFQIFPSYTKISMHRMTDDITYKIPYALFFYKNAINSAVGQKVITSFLTPEVQILGIAIG